MDIKTDKYGKRTVYISQEQAETILQLKLGGLDLLPNFQLMCRGWSEDNDFQELGTDSLENVADGEYYNFELWEK
jgi:hypothetical protein